MGFLIGRINGHQTPQQTGARDVIAALFTQLRQPEEQIAVQPAQPFTRSDGPVFIQIFRQQIATIEIERRLEQLWIVRSQRSRSPALESFSVNEYASRSAKRHQVVSDKDEPRSRS